MSADNDLKEAIAKMRSTFFVPLANEEKFARFRSLVASLPTDYVPLAETFRQNLESFLATISMPYSLAAASSTQGHFQRLHIAERIRARKIEADAIGAEEELEEVRDRKALRIAENRMQEFAASDDGRNSIISEICRFLKGSISNGLEEAAHELLRQGIILLWSAFEVFARDVFELYVNQDVNRTDLLNKDPTTRKIFETDRFSFDTMRQCDFDLSRKIGTVLVGRQDFSNLQAIKSTFPVLFPTATDLIKALGKKDLWVLSQRRHLIAHRRGVVDRDYLNATGETLALGSRIQITPPQLESDLIVILENGEALCRAISTAS